MKLWKVTVNNWGWSNAMTYYFKDKAEAKKFSNKYPASDGVEYAGNFTEKNANCLKIMKIKKGNNMKRYFVQFKSDRYENNMYDIEKHEYGSYDHVYGSASSIKTCKGYISRIKKVYAAENPRDFRIYDSYADIDPVTDHVPYVYREA